MEQWSLLGCCSVTVAGMKCMVARVLWTDLEAPLQIITAKCVKDQDSLSPRMIPHRGGLLLSGLSCGGL